jgi:hypothetical protein
MPDAESLRLEVFTGEAVKARDAIEYRNAFVVDVQIYLRSLEWWEAYIILGRMVKPGEDQVTWRKLVAKLKDIGQPYPKKLKHHSNLFVQYRDIIKPNAEAYFRDRGYIR